MRSILVLVSTVLFVPTTAPCQGNSASPWVPTAASGSVDARLARAEVLLRQGLADEALVLCREDPMEEAAAEAPPARASTYESWRAGEPWRASAARLTGGLWQPLAVARPLDERSRARLAYGRGICLGSGASGGPGSSATPGSNAAPGSAGAPGSPGGQGAASSAAGAAEASPLARAVEAFGTSRALAGPGALRLDAVENLAHLSFAAGEYWRAQIPELSAGGQAAASGPAHSASGGTEPEVDPLEAARGAYLTGREWLIERLRLVPYAERRTAQIRVLTELTLRRLRELEEIEREREESEDQQEGEDGEEGEEGEQNSDQEPQAGDEQDGESGEEQQEEEPEGEAEDEEQQSAGDEEQGEDAQEAPEQVMTKEEVMRLLQALEQIEAEGEELQERLRRVRRVPGDKDW
ncbi:MAG: hypothetical protein QF411_01630 [Planctomycetota bacterium]|nr:hypothetical protein [Planctomycetota bacterium]